MPSHVFMPHANALHRCITASLFCWRTTTPILTFPCQGLTGTYDWAYQISPSVWGLQVWGKLCKVGALSLAILIIKESYSE